MPQHRCEYQPVGGKASGDVAVEAARIAVLGNVRKGLSQSVVKQLLVLPGEFRELGRAARGRRRDGAQRGKHVAAQPITQPGRIRIGRVGAVRLVEPGQVVEDLRARDREHGPDKRQRRRGRQRARPGDRGKTPRRGPATETHKDRFELIVGVVRGGDVCGAGLSGGAGKSTVTSAAGGGLKVTAITAGVNILPRVRQPEPARKLRGKPRIIIRARPQVVMDVRGGQPQPPPAPRRKVVQGTQQRDRIRPPGDRHEKVIPRGNPATVTQRGRDGFDGLGGYRDHERGAIENDSVTAKRRAGASA